jgi:regulatory protein
MPTAPGGPAGLMQYAVALLARREHSRAELARKLRRRAERDAPADPSADPAADIEGVLDRLQAQGLLSDQRFAAVLARGRASRFGTARIRAEMRQHELADHLIKPVLEELHASEEQRAWELWRRRFGRVPADAAERARQMRFLAQRGFAPGVILRIVKGGDPPE